ncbi:MAG: ATP-grasp domain-containing protein [Deltaproteobacteria bacterium]
MAVSPKPAKKKGPARPRIVGILSRKRSLYTTSRMVEAAKARGHKALVLDTLRCAIGLERAGPAIFYDSRPLGRLDVVIPRIGSSITPYGLAVVNQLDMMGVPVLNNSVPIARSRDKLRCLQLLARFGVDIPRTVVTRNRSEVEAALKRIGGLPAILKLIQGTQGVGVMIAHTLEEIEGILGTMKDLGQEILLQEFIHESRGCDVRALVVGDQVVGAMRRRAREGEFRSNLHRGGEGKPISLSKAYAETAVRATRIMGLEVAGVDMLETRSGPKVMEVNSSPGFEGLEAATGTDVAGRIVEHAIQFAEARATGWSRQRLI